MEGKATIICSYIDSIGEINVLYFSYIPTHVIIVCFVPKGQLVTFPAINLAYVHPATSAYNSDIHKSRIIFFWPPYK